MAQSLAQSAERVARNVAGERGGHALPAVLVLVLLPTSPLLGQVRREVQVREDCGDDAHGCLVQGPDGLLLAFLVDGRLAEMLQALLRVSFLGGAGGRACVRSGA